MGLKISLEKNKVVSNCKEVLREIEKIMLDVKMKPVTQAIQLGVDYAAGAPVKFAKANDRLKKATIKTKALLGYCKRGWRTTNIVKAHVVGATMYGVRVVGIKPQQLSKVRALIRSTTTSSNSGGSTTAILALQRCRDLDPAYKATTLPVLEWVERVNNAKYMADCHTVEARKTTDEHEKHKHTSLASKYRQQLDRHREAWEAQKRVVMTEADPWTKVCGPPLL